jgi:hypothetical protein
MNDAEWVGEPTRMISHDFNARMMISFSAYIENQSIG